MMPQQQAGPMMAQTQMQTGPNMMSQQQQHGPITSQSQQGPIMSQSQQGPITSQFQQGQSQQSQPMMTSQAHPMVSQVGAQSFTSLMAEIHQGINIRYPKEIMKMERHFNALQRWLQK